MDKRELIDKIKEYGIVLDDYFNYNFKEDDRWDDAEEFIEDLSYLLNDISIFLRNHVKEN